MTEIFRRAYGRPPDPEESQATLQHWHQMERVQAAIKYQPREYPITVARQAVEENTGEPFTFTERLFEFEDYIHDLQPNETDARTRALADVCLAVLNSNEFVFTD